MFLGKGSGRKALFWCVVEEKWVGGCDVSRI